LNTKSRSTLCPYTTLFRSREGQGKGEERKKRERGRGRRQRDTTQQEIRGCSSFSFSSSHPLLSSAPSLAPLHPPSTPPAPLTTRSEEHTSELQSRFDHVCR